MFAINAIVRNGTKYIKADVLRLNLIRFYIIQQNHHILKNMTMKHYMKSFNDLHKIATCMQS